MLEGLTRDEQIKVCGVFAKIDLHEHVYSSDKAVSWSKRRNRENDESKIMYHCSLNGITHEQMTQRIELTKRLVCMLHD